MSDPLVDPRKELVDDRDRTAAFVTQLREEYRGFVEASRDTNADDEHDPEGSTIAFERAQVGSVILAADRRLEEIQSALERLDAGAYGGCECCGKPIPTARLAVRPAARACVGCA
ncbi:MAG: TraR/DksA C4-type zinc finger protein [Nocardioides sp.]|nr:TraR/DksA C4-type zinc finger protein [Nocardioides sp.]